MKLLKEGWEQIPETMFGCAAATFGLLPRFFFVLIFAILFSCLDVHNVYTPCSKQESLANAKVNARQHCVSLSCLCKTNSLTQIEWVADFSLGDEDSENIVSERYENRHLR